MKSKHLRVGVVIGLIILILLASSSGVTSNRQKRAVGKEAIDTREAVWVLARAGLNLKASENPVIDPDQCLSGGVVPKVYDLDEEGLGQLYIYEFDSTVDRRNYTEGLESENIAFLQQIPHRAYGAKNLVLVMTYNLSQDNWQEDIEKLAPIALTLGKTIFYDLNQGRKWVLYGEGEHWEAKLVVSGFEEWWTDKDGYKMSKCYYAKIPLVKYKGNPEEIKDISYSFEYLSGKSTLAGEGFSQSNFDEDRTNFYGGSPIFWGSFGFSSTYILDEKQLGKFSVQWNGENEESFELTLREP